MNGIAVKLSADILSVAKVRASTNSRSVSKQIEYWARIGKIAEENPDLPYEFIKNILEARKEMKRGEISDFEFRVA
ncbi:MAG: ParD-like family protein [Chitinispirillales bacterium]|jgi:hypothetical protein|nr:ParD-like family protein [Chitinispirillales bacterium]